MWSVEFVEVPDETQGKSEKPNKEPERKDTSSAEAESDSKLPSIQRLCSLEDTVSETTVDTAQDFRDSDLLSVKDQETELASSVESGGTLTEAMSQRENIIDSKEGSPDIVVLGRSEYKRRNESPATSVKEETLSVDIDKASMGDGDNSSNLVSPPVDFEMVTDTEVNTAMKSVEDVLDKLKGATRRKLRPGINFCFILCNNQGNYAYTVWVYLFVHFRL